MVKAHKADDTKSYKKHKKDKKHKKPKEKFKEKVSLLKLIFWK